MSLVDPPRVQRGPRVRVLPTVLASIVATAIFIVVLSVVARVTADSAVVVVRAVDAGIDLVDAGFDASDVDAGGVDAGDVGAGFVDAGFVDAGFVDAGPPAELVTVSIDAGPDVDGGPADVEGPPYDVDDVIAVGRVLVEACARDGLRWDPSLGGAFTLRVTLPEAGPTSTSAVVEADGLRSPVLSSCLKRRTPTLTWPPGATDLLVPQQVVAAASLSSDGRVKLGAVEVRAVP